MSESKLKNLIVVTGNKNKLAEFQKILEGQIELTNKNIDLPELQGEPIDIAKAKILLAYKETQAPVICEDTSLCFNALKGLPGPYIKWFLDSIGLDGLNKLLAGFDDKTAYAQCIIGYMGPELSEPITFVGRTPGSIVEARGPNAFGWDPIFQPEGYAQTYAEISKDVKNQISHRYKAIEKLKEYFASNKKVKKE